MKKPPNPAYKKIQKLHAGFSRSEQLLFGRLYLTVHEGRSNDTETVLDDFERRFPEAKNRAFDMMDELSRDAGLTAWELPRRYRTRIQLPSSTSD